MIILNFCFKEFRFGLHADSIVLVDFLHVLRSIEGRFTSVPNPFEQALGLFCHNYSFVNPSWDVLHLSMSGMRWCVFVNEGCQGAMILFVETIGFLGGLLIRSEARRSVFIFSLLINDIYKR